MDERKWTFRKLIKFSLIIAVSFSSILCIYGLVVFLQTKTIENPKKCFTTSMNKVRLCSSSAQYVFYKEVPEHFFHSLILSEDASFYSHKGFDWFEIKESFRRNFSEWKFSRGGSTLTQQLAKNLYLSRDKTLTRKFKEFFISKQIEDQLTKRQILEKYINVVEFGKNIYGLKQASQTYFNKPAQALTPLESVYLVSLLPSPKRLSKGFSQRRLSKDNLWRMTIILKRLYRFKKISDDLFIYLEMLLEEYPWPFDYYSEDGFDSQSIEDQMMLEFDEVDQEESAEAFPENENEDENLSEDNSEEATLEAEPIEEQSEEDENEENEEKNSSPSVESTPEEEAQPDTEITMPPESEDFP